MECWNASPRAVYGLADEAEDEDGVHRVQRRERHNPEAVQRVRLRPDVPGHLLRRLHDPDPEPQDDRDLWSAKTTL